MGFRCVVLTGKAFSRVEPGRGVVRVYPARGKLWFAKDGLESRVRGVQLNYSETKVLNPMLLNAGSNQQKKSVYSFCEWSLSKTDSDEGSRHRHLFSWSYSSFWISCC